MQTKLEDYKQEVEELKIRLSELGLKRAGLASQNKILEETAAAVEARNEKVGRVTFPEAPSLLPHGVVGGGGEGLGKVVYSEQVLMAHMYRRS